MTIEEKAAILSGKTVWQTREIDRLSIPSIFLSDGPHGIRKQAGAGDHLGLNASLNATCFPTAATIANSWNQDLGEEIGQALGEEAASMDVNILLGPGLNIKRSPLCGRNFEYFSEDPYLSGKMAASYIRGIQSKGVYACPKHLAVNSQELRRMAMDAVVDERTLREIYLTGFEIAGKEGHANAIMSSYNQINGIYANEDKHLLTDILRKEWGFDGIVVTDWGGSNDHVKGVSAGSNLEMPSCGYDSAREVIAAVRNGKLKEADLDERVGELVDEVMELLDIAAYRDRNPFDLSGGQMQRVALAGILAMKPEVIVLDEPTSQLDPAGSEEVFAAVDKLAKSGITIIMVEQKLEKLAEYCDKILLLHQGKQIAFDTPEQIFSRADLQSYGVNPPAYTRICQAFGLKKENGCYPASLKDALALKDLFPGEEAFCPEKILLDNNKDMKNKNGQMEHSVTTDESMKLTISCKKNVFDIEHLEFQYLENVPVLQDINLTIDHRPTAIIGQNGAGKTTLVKLLKGLLKPMGGSIYYGGSDMAEKTVAMLAGEIGYVFQNPDDQIFKYHVIDEVMFGPQNIGMTKEQAKEKAVAALKLVGLEQLADENPYDLELSERKLVAIASVLAMDTKVLILDEPTIAQDWKGRKIIQKMIWDLSSQGKTVIAILHDMDFVAESFERVIVMAHGKVLADGTKEEVFAQKDVLEQARIDQPYLTKLCQQLGYKKLYFSLKD